MSIQEEAINELQKQKKIMWLGFIFFGLCGGIGIFDKNFLLMIIGFSFVMAAIYVLWKIQHETFHVSDYKRGKGFKFFRKSKAAKKIELTIVQFFCIIFPIIVVLYFDVPFVSIIMSIVIVAFIEFYTKRRLEAHKQVDEHVLKELVDVGVISSNLEVKALYKEFVSLKEAKNGSKIIYITNDALTISSIKSYKEDNRQSYKLLDIKKLGIIGGGTMAKGLLIMLETTDSRVRHLKIDGDKYNSPEMFVKYFLEALDEALLAEEVC